MKNRSFLYHIYNDFINPIEYSLFSNKNKISDITINK